MRVKETKWTANGKKIRSLTPNKAQTETSALRHMPLKLLFLKPITAGIGDEKNKNNRKEKNPGESRANVK